MSAADGASLSQEIAQLSQLALDVRAVDWFTAACLTLTTWDTITNYSREVKYIWRSHWNGVKVLYFILRYVLPAYQVIMFVGLSHSTANVAICKGISYFGLWAAPPLQIPSMMVQILRLYAIWSKNRTVLVISTTASVLAMVCFIVSAALETHIEDTFTSNPTSQIFGCRFSANPTNPTELQQVISMEWVASSVLETIFILLLIPRYLSYLRTESTGTVLKVLLRDGFVYYVIMLVNGIGNAVLTFLVPQSRQALLLLLDPWMTLTQSIVMCHMLLNVKEAASDLSPGATKVSEFVSRDIGTWNVASNIITSTAPAATIAEEDGYDHELWIAPPRQNIMSTLSA